ncbi:MAG: cystathionine gamma-synthase [Planctomycetota bacterium]|nr:cystathionine gamma-synthase [Planctomycetota bacterium]
MRFSTKAIHAGQPPDPSTGAIMVPVYQSSTFVQAEPGVDKGYPYSRTANPTRKALEDCVAALEGGAVGLALASGMAAIDCVLRDLRSGDHVVAGEDLYGGTRRLFSQCYEKFGVQFSYVDTTDLDATAAAVRKETRIIWIETPSNPLMRITDLGAVAKIGSERGIRTVADNTFATPFLQRPLEKGFDVVVHSTTKYMGGHSDVIGGAIITADPKVGEELAYYQNAVGGVPGPMDCFLVLRGLKTLALRMERHSFNGMEVAKFLQGHPKVDRVFYPGLDGDPGHVLAKEQMDGFGGIVSFIVKGGVEAARRCATGTRLFALAESLGGVESLLDHPATMTHTSVPPEERVRIGLEDGLIRLSVGVEEIEDLLEDLAAALEGV